mgnify:FL=1
MQNLLLQYILERVFGNPKIFKFFQEKLLPKKYTIFKKELTKKYANLNDRVLDFACSTGDF